MTADHRRNAAALREAAGAHGAGPERVGDAGRLPGARFARARVGWLAVVVCGLTLALGAATANASFLSQVKTFGSQGSGAGQFNTPLGVAIQQTSGSVFVADSGNARVDKFDASGNFLLAFGWGVADGKARAEVCTSSCQAGIAGSGAGQFSRPTSIAVGPPGTPSAGKVFVGDAGNNVVEKFDANGSFVSTIDGTSTPQGHFQSLVGVTVDQTSNLWTADGSTDNVDEFNASGAFVQQWTDTHGSPSAIAVDAGFVVYLLTQISTQGLIQSGGGFTESWTLTGTPRGQFDQPTFLSKSRGSGSALALDPSTGNLYVDHNGSSIADVAVYHKSGSQLDDLTLPSTANSQGLAFRTSAGNPHGKQNLYLSDASANNVTIYAPQTTPGAPLITSESGSGGLGGAELDAGIVPLGHPTGCAFQLVDNANFQASGYSNATTVDCGFLVGPVSGFTYQPIGTTAVSGLTVGTVYHFRAVATSSAGTTIGADQEFQEGPGPWAPFFRCPVGAPRMLATNNVVGGMVEFCLGSNSTHGSITLGKITTATGNTNLQTGLVLNDVTFQFSVIPASGGSLVADPVQLSSPLGPVTAVTESAGTPSNFNLFAGLETGVPIITVPVKIHLENPALGPSCFIGSNQDPILLNPQNTDTSNDLSVGGFFSFDPNGFLDVTGRDGALEITGLVQGDDTFAVPGATGCGTNGSLDAAVDAVAGVPSPSGSNHLVLDDASSALGFPQLQQSGQGYANDWHVGFR